MKNRTKLLIGLSFILESSIAQNKPIVPAREFLIRGIDEAVVYSVIVKEHLTDRASLYLYQDKKEIDSLNLDGDRGIETIDIESEAFLGVNFKIRGGTGTAVRRAAFICASRGKLYKCIDVISDVTSRLTEVYDKKIDSLKLFDEKEDYHLRLFIKQEGNSYMAVLAESKTIESKYDPSQNVFFEKEYELNFDLGGLFFYNSNQRLNKLYKVHSARGDQTREKFISRDVPCIQLFENKYLYLDGEWCLDNGQDVLNCL